MMISMVLLKVEHGPMAKYEKNAAEYCDLFSGPNPCAMLDQEDESKGSVVDLVLPILVLVGSCAIGMIYSGGCFSGTDFVAAFSNSGASVGLMLDSVSGFAFNFVYYLVRRSMTFTEMMDCIPEGFKAMVPAIVFLIGYGRARRGALRGVTVLPCRNGTEKISVPFFPFTALAGKCPL